MGKRRQVFEVIDISRYFTDRGRSCLQMAEQNSDSGSESDEADGGVGNVNRIVVRPPGQSGKAKKGNLIFDASYEGGNLGRVDYISDFEYDLFIRPDTCNPRFRVWFNFTVENVRAEQRVIFNIVNISKDRGLYRDGLCPLVKSSSRPKWRKLPTKYVYYYVSPEHKNHYVLSFIFGFDREDEVYHFAYSYPYSYSRLQTYLEELEKQKFPFMSIEIIGFSLQHRPLSVLTIGKGESGAKQRKTVVITSRVHPGETPASYVVQGLVDYLVSEEPMAKILRDYVIFKIIPMLNPDGVFLGNYRTSMMGFDLNRSWSEANPWAHPTLYATKNLMRQLNGDNAVDLDFFIDIHAHSSLKGSFVYGNQYDDVYRAERHSLFPKLLGQVAEDFNPAASIYNRDPNKNGTARRFFATMLKDKANCYTLEVSFFGYHPKNGSDVALLVPYTDDGYKRLGRNLARAFFEYYCLSNHIPPAVGSVVTSTHQGKSRDRSRASAARKGKGGKSSSVVGGNSGTVGFKI